MYQILDNQQVEQIRSDLHKKHREKSSLGKDLLRIGIGQAIQVNKKEWRKLYKSSSPLCLYYRFKPERTFKMYSTPDDSHWIVLRTA